MSTLKEGKNVCISVKALFERKSSITQGLIVTEKQDHTIYYDLYNNHGELATLDGELCQIERIESEVITLSNSNGENTVYFKLTCEEADTALSVVR